MKATAAQDSQKTIGKGDTLMREKEIDNLLQCDTTAGQNQYEQTGREPTQKLL